MKMKRKPAINASVSSRAKTFNKNERESAQSSNLDEKRSSRVSETLKLT
jgi:hypothetical protein